jgi:hypothetical protein
MKPHGECRRSTARILRPVDDYNRRTAGALTSLLSRVECSDQAAAREAVTV